MINKTKGVIGIIAYQILTDMKIDTNLKNGCKKITQRTNIERIKKVVKIKQM